MFVSFLIFTLAAIDGFRHIFRSHSLLWIAWLACLGSLESRLRIQTGCCLEIPFVQPVSAITNRDTCDAANLTWCSSDILMRGIRLVWTPNIPNSRTTTTYSQICFINSQLCRIGFKGYCCVVCRSTERVSIYVARLDRYCMFAHYWCMSFSWLHIIQWPPTCPLM